MSIKHLRSHTRTNTYLYLHSYNSAIHLWNKIPDKVSFHFISKILDPSFVTHHFVCKYVQMVAKTLDCRL